MTVPSTDDSAQRRPVALIVAVSVTAIVVVGVLVWILTTRDARGPAVLTYTPAEETTASSPATSSAVASALAGEGASGTVTSGQSTDTATAAAGKIAFRLGRSLYVANTDGSGAVAMKNADTVYSLAPDGTALAVVRAGKLIIELVPAGAAVVVGATELVTPVWLSDSSALLFVRAGAQGVPQVWRVKRDGTGAALVSGGVAMAASPDGTKLALLGTEDEAQPAGITVLGPGRSKRAVTVAGGAPVAVAVSGDTLFVSTMSLSGVASIRRSTLDGSSSRELVGPMAGDGKGTAYGRLLLSPDGRSLAYTADGDDGYSRIWVVPVAGGSPRQVTSRRDGYLMSWSSDNRSVFFFEGNSFQGETSALWRADPDGSHRRMLVSGAVQ